MSKDNQTARNCTNLNVCLVIGRIQSDGLSTSRNSHPEKQDILFVQRRYFAVTASEAPKYVGDALR